MRAGSADMASGELEQRVYLYVPYEERREAFRAGAAFDEEHRAWYRLEGQDPALFSRWANPPPPLTPEAIKQQFAEALLDAGLELDGDPIMDGKWHRTTVSTSRDHKALKGAYIGHIAGDGANGFIDNKDTGVKFGWKAKGTMSPDIQVQRAQAEADAARRRIELHEAHVTVAREAQAKWAELREVTDSHAYLDRKQIEALGLRRSDSRLAVPVRDADHVLWNIQYINEDGQKLFMKGGAKEGHFHVLGDLVDAPLILSCEGYATGASLHMATGLPVVVVFDSGNYKAVLEQLTKRYPDAKWLLCGDEDLVNEQSVLARVNSATESKRGVEMALGPIAAQELVFDGVARPLKSVPDCTLRLEYVDSPQHQAISGGVSVPLKRVSGELEKDGQRLSILVRNAGREAVVAAAEAFKCGACFPQFSSLEGRPTDWNDLHVREGLSTVAYQVVTAIQEQGLSSNVQALAEKILGTPAQVIEPDASGRYVGQMVANVGTHLLQGVGRQTAVAHSVLDLDRVPRDASAVGVTYRDGKGFVDGARATERGGHGR